MQRRKDLCAWTLTGKHGLGIGSKYRIPNLISSWMFDCCRIPGSGGKDWSVTFAKEGDLGDSGHIVVFRKNRPWKVEVARNGELLSSQNIEEWVNSVTDMADA
jgi:hypothetical protein